MRRAAAASRQSLFWSAFKSHGVFDTIYPRRTLSTRVHTKHGNAPHAYSLKREGGEGKVSAAQREAHVQKKGKGIGEKENEKRKQQAPAPPRTYALVFSLQQPRGDESGARRGNLVILLSALENRTNAARGGELGDVAGTPIIPST